MGAGVKPSEDSVQLRRGPLVGVRIVDFTENMSGPLGTMILGDQGADVIKVEPPGGDSLRAVGTRANGMAAFFANINRSKRSLALNLKAEKALDVVASLVDGADVVLHNFRPTAATKLGIDANSLCAGRPRLIHVTITGFGRLYLAMATSSGVRMSPPSWYGKELSTRSRRTTLLRL
jgi:crotonobetainyl-CoA:carnitine CoA-transferase CaiB-like acyl-CoA transferase